MIQKKFKITPDYIELEIDPDNGYTMGVYIALGAPIYSFEPYTCAKPFSNFGSLDELESYYEKNGKVLVFMAKGTNKTKKKAEQLACEQAIQLCNNNQ